MATGGNLTWDDSARWGRRLYVFAVTAAATFFLALLVWGVVDSTAEPSRKPVAPKTVANPAAALPWGDLEAGRRDVIRARRQLTAAELELFQFLNRQFMTVAEGSAATPIASAAPITPAPVEVAPAPVVPQIVAAPDDPKRAVLEQQLREAESQREKLLVTLQPSHPRVTGLDETINELRALLGKQDNAAAPAPSANVQQAAPAPESELIAPSEPITNGNTAANAVAAIEISAETKSEYQRLLLAAGKARSRYELQLDHERATWRQFGEDIQRPLAPKPSLQPAPAAIANPAPTGVMLWFSLAVASIVAAGVRRKPAVFLTAAEIERKLNFPVLGVIPASWRQTGEGLHAMQTATLDPRWVRGSTAFSQWVLALAAGVLLVLSIVDAPVLHDVILKPLSGLF